MTTREENIKKINEELEKLNDEQLEQVAGGITGSWLSFINPNTNPDSNQPGVKAAVNWLK